MADDKQIRIVGSFEGVQSIVMGVRQITDALKVMDREVRGLSFFSGAGTGMGAQIPNPFGGPVAGAPAAGGGLGMAGIAGMATGAVAASITTNKNLLMGLAKISKDSLRGLGDIVGKELEQERTAVDKLNASLEKLNTTYGQRLHLVRKGKMPEMEGDVIKDQEATVRNLVGRIGQHQGAIQDKEALKQAIQEAMGEGKGRGGLLSGLWGSRLGRWGMAGVGFSVARDAVTTGLHMPQALDRFEFQRMAASAEAFGGMGVQMARGDVRPLFALARANPALMQRIQDMGSDSRLWMESAGNLAGAVGFGMLTSPVSTTVGAMQKNRMLETTQKQSIAEAVQALQRASPRDMAMLDMFQQMAPGNVAAMRRIGSVQGFRDMAGLTRKHTVPWEDVMGAFEGVRGIAGPGAHAERGTDAVLAAKKAGLDAGTAARVTGAELSVGSDTRLLEAMVGSGLNRRAAETIGEAIAGRLEQHGLGSTRGVGTFGAMGMGGGNVTMQQARQRLGGLDALNRFATGAVDPAQRFLNLSQATEILGPGSSIIAKRELANMPVETILDVMKGAPVPEIYQTEGITGTHIGKRLSSLVQGIINRGVVNEATDPANKAYRLVRNKFKADPMAYLESLKTQSERMTVYKALRGMFHAADPEGFTPAQSQGAMDLLSGAVGYDPLSGLMRGEGVDPETNTIGLGGRFFNPGRGASFPRGSGDVAAGTPEEAATTAQLDWPTQVREAAGEFGKLVETTKVLYPLLQRAAVEFERIGKVETDAKDAAAGLQELTKAAQAASAVLDPGGLRYSSSPTGASPD